MSRSRYWMVNPPHTHPKRKPTWFPNALLDLLIAAIFAGSALLAGCTAQPVPVTSGKGQQITPSTSPATPSQVPAATLSPTTSTSIAALSVTSTLDGQTTLPHRIQWVAKPSIPESQVSEVDFLVDGQLAFMEQRKPYTFGRDGNYLVTSFLTPGQHSFTVRLLAIGGQQAESTVKANVAAAGAPPTAIANTTWSRQVTNEDIKQATSKEPPPSGQWSLTIDATGWMVHDPQGGGLLFDVAYPSEGKVELRPTIEKPPYPNPNGGAFCEEPDPSILWSYTIGDNGKTLTLSPAGNDPCGDRLAVLKGTWTISASQL